MQVSSYAVPRYAVNSNSRPELLKTLGILNVKGHKGQTAAPTRQVLEESGVDSKWNI